MNFHKTIGFLAALLLTLGIGVPDSFAQDEGTITLTVTPAATLTENADLSANKVTVTVGANVTLETAAQDADDPQTRTVTVKVTPTDDSYTVAPATLTIDVVVPAGQASAAANVEKTMVFTINTDPDRESEALTFTATSPDLTDATDTAQSIADVEVALPVADQAIDASGIRVLLVSPGNGEYASVGERTVKVQLLRKDGLASEWGNYTGITVALWNRNPKGDGDVHPDGNTTPAVAIHTLAIDNTAGQLGTLAISALRRDTLYTTGVAVDGTTNLIEGTTPDGRITYRRRTADRGYDTLEFEFNITEGDATSGTSDLNKVYARATFASSNANYSADDLNSFDTDTSIYPENPSAFPEKVGDGNFIKIDRSTPNAGVIRTLTVKVVDKNKAGGSNAGIGDEIQISGSINAQFRDHSIKLVFISPEVFGFDAGAGDIVREAEDPATAGTTVLNDGDDLIVVDPGGELVGFSTTIPATKIFEDRGSISHKFRVAANQFKRKYTADGPDDSDIKKGATFADDNIIAQVQAQVMDKAGNKIPQTVTSDVFTLDSKAPKVTIAHPDSSHERFTTKNAQSYTFLGDGSVALELKALNFEVSEDHDGGYVFIGGGAVATNDTLFFTASGNTAVTSGDDVDLSKLTKNPKMSNKNNNAKAPHQETAHNKGKSVVLQIVAMDPSGNSSVPASPVAGTSGAAGTAIYDNKAPVIQRLFPNNTDLARQKPVRRSVGGQRIRFSALTKLWIRSWFAIKLMMVPSSTKRVLLQQWARILDLNSPTGFSKASYIICKSMPETFRVR